MLHKTAALERLKIPPKTYNEENVGSTLKKLFSYLRIIKTILMTVPAGSQVSDLCILGYSLLMSGL